MCSVKARVEPSMGWMISSTDRQLSCSHLLDTMFMLLGSVCVAFKYVSPRHPPNVVTELLNSVSPYYHRYCTSAFELQLRTASLGLPRAEQDVM